MPPKHRQPRPGPSKPPETKLQANRPKESPSTTTTETPDPTRFPFPPLRIPTQQLLLDTFKSALLPSTPNDFQSPHLPVRPLIQEIKSHLYNRDFEAAFTDAGGEVLRAYALRWSAGRALGYAGIFRGVVDMVLGRQKHSGKTREAKGSRGRRKKVVCVGGGGGAEIMGFVGAWRDLVDQSQSRSEPQDEDEDEIWPQEGEEGEGMTVLAVDIADWSEVISRLDNSIRCSSIPGGTKECRPPLLADSSLFRIGFERADVLDQETQIETIFGDHGNPEEETGLVTLMFTLNELFSTSPAKATGFLLRMTDSLRPGTVLLVVDSPGSYSTVRLGGKEQQQKERNYPMKFLLDHTLLSVARGKWERVFSQDSRWWRRDAARLRYDLDGVGLEDMRFQIHIYRRVEES